MKINEYYKKGRYEDKELSGRKAYHIHRMSLIARYITPHPQWKVLDAGCGDGSLAQIVRDKWHVIAHGVDISKRGVSIAKKRGIDTKVSDINKQIPYNSNYFDMVIVNEVIEHLYNPDVLLKECKRVLKKDGYLMLATPNLSSWFNRILFFLGMYPLFLEASTEVQVGLGKFKGLAYYGQPVGHVHVFNLPAIVDLLAYHGYQIENIIGQPVSFKSKKWSIITKIYQFFDSIFSRYPSLSADLIIIARI